MPARLLLVAAALATMAALALVFVLVWQPWSDASGGDGATEADQPRMTTEGVIALVSAEHAGCPEQPALVLTADVVYDGDGQWTVTYGDYRWEVDEGDGSVRTMGEALPCPER